MVFKKHPPQPTKAVEGVLVLILKSFNMRRINIDIFRFTHLLKDDHVAESDIPSFIDALKQNH